MSDPWGTPPGQGDQGGTTPPGGYPPPAAGGFPPPSSGAGYPGGYAGGYGAYPAGYGYGAPMAKPSNNLVLAILSTLLCCLPLGIVSIVFASQVDSKWNAGDYQGAIDASEKAKKWAFASAGAALVLGLLYVVFIIVVAGSTTSGY